ncbi:prolyl-tRNA synthetase associated domain-containing protein [Dehalobacterium formicoaceticum]|uniref:Prolyl-tRNA synthetase associated domain-containing protein n=1 Tax=Dehalobacterium formicoaceticum TaxID=51515 RepID=A0ABT1Y2U0_9FIRM|nr:prolyl-tRNA synthetase associated domain-containing protein [Dehalobacterium formicoaceticum]MCR6544269.1 prolyl-tRNA synthetase associated domain-containing protein [Dehalobacterium formicoaceticum]
MLGKSEIYDLLNRREIEYTAFEHIPVYTIGEMMALDLPAPEKVVKNLFLRDDKGRNHYLVVLAGHKSVNLKDLAAKISSRSLSFASESRLKKHLGLEPGGVTPLGILNNAAHDVTVVFDHELKDQDLIGVHPMENTATIFMKFEDLLKLVQEQGNPIVFCEILAD